MSTYLKMFFDYFKSLIYIDLRN